MESARRAVPPRPFSFFRFSLLKSDGNPRTPAVAKTLPPNGVLADSFGSIFPGIAPNRTDYIRVASSGGLIPFEHFGRLGRFVMGLRGHDTSAGGTVLYCPQYVVGGASWRSALSIINLDAAPGSVALKFIGGDGSQIGSTRSVAIAAQGKIFIEDQSFFGTQAGEQREGYLAITSDGPKLAGSVIFGDSASSTYSTALPLVATLRTAMVFSHVASNPDYYVGLAFANPNNAPAEVTIEVFASEGNRIASGTESIPAGGRKSRLLTDYIAGLKGQNLSSGYIKVTTTREVAGFALFGTNKGTVLAAVPPQVVP